MTRALNRPSGPSMALWVVSENCVDRFDLYGRRLSPYAILIWSRGGRTNMGREQWLESLVNHRVQPSGYLVKQTKINPRTGDLTIEVRHTTLSDSSFDVVVTQQQLEESVETGQLVEAVALYIDDQIKQRNGGGGCGSRKR
jgi:hypothetical protein